jgi:WXG100 family type VII secretion target
MARNVSSGSFKVDLAALQNAIGKVSGHRDAMLDQINTLKQTVNLITTSLWKGPAGDSFTEYSAKFTSASDTVVNLLNEAIGKMQSAHKNYSDTEHTNARNLRVTDSGGGGKPDQGKPAQHDDSSRSHSGAGGDTLRTKPANSGGSGSGTARATLRTVVE